MSLKNIEPQAVWQHFSDINAIPRASKKEERIIAYMKEFGEQLQLDTQVDINGNVLIKKPATTGFEHKKGIILQAHLDMVHQKNNDTVFDFDTQGIEMIIDGDWVKAKGTTLGADNGLGVAMIMTILASTTIQHPDIEALFTIDEETGMTGALTLAPGFLSHKIMINLDTEEDNEITIGCAGGVDVTGLKTYDTIVPPTNYIGLQINVKGLSGGHSGMEIHKELGNANKLMNRLLYHLCSDGKAMIASIDGGGLRNAIPRESVAKLCLHPGHIADFKSDFDILKQIITAEYASKEPLLNLNYEEIQCPYSAMDPTDEMTLLNTVYSLHNGVYSFSTQVPGLVETSNNVARILVKDGKTEILCLSRSSTETGKEQIVNQLKAVFALGGMQVSIGGSYPGWSPNASSEILTLAKEIYVKRNNAEPKVSACHAGLECGIIGQHYDNLDMISIGPNILGAHSPEERASISSMQKFWPYLLELIENTPAK